MDALEGWRRIPLGNIAEVRLGRQRSPSRAFGPNMRPYLRAANVGWEGLKLDDVKKMDFTPSEYEVYRLQAGDIVLNEASGSPSEVGKPAVWRDEIPGACFQNTLIRVRPNKSEALSEFLYYHFLRDALTQAFADASTGTNIQHIGQAKLASWLIHLPPINEQRKIVAILSSVDEAIKTAQAVIGQIQEVTKALMHHLLTKGLPRHHRKFKQTVIGDIPEEWDLRPGNQLFTLTGGHAPSSILFSSHGDSLFIKVNTFNLPENLIAIAKSDETFRTKENPSVRCFGPGSLVFPKRGAAIFKNRIGLIIRPSAVDPNLMVLTPNDTINAEFFRYLLLHIGLYKICDNSGIPQINNKHLYPAVFQFPR
ncbi:MAG: hypothetical protein HC927_00040 [Deltaproteobacteria bacterium]|nr:hypothetical protein [Deltaproteobacteria bacterium]